MLDTEREAKRLMSDPSSWSQGGIKKKAYRAMALTPDEEVPRGRMKKARRKKHVHKWGEWTLLREEVQRVWWSRPRTRRTVYTYSRSCKKCGLKDQARTTQKGNPRARGYYF